MHRMRTLAIIVGTLLALGLGAADLHAQAWAGAGRLKVEVTDQEGNPVPGATVTYRMFEERDTGPPAFTTDKKGRVSFLGLRGGPWYVRVEAEGYHPWEGAYEVFSHGAPELLEVELEALPEEYLEAKKRGAAQERVDRAADLLQEGDVQGARAEYEAALGELDLQDHPVVLSLLASTYVVTGDVDRAKALLEQSLEIDPDHVASLKNLCAIVASQGDVDAAEELLQKIPGDESLHPTTTINIGMAHYNRGEMDRAKELLDRTVRDHPDEAQAYYFRGLINLSLGDTAQAKSDLESFVEMAPDHPQVAEAKEYLGYLQNVPVGEEGATPDQE